MDQEHLGYYLCENNRLSHDISFVFASRIYKGLFSESFCVCEKARFALQAKGGMLYVTENNLNLTHKKDLREILTNFNMVLNAGDKAVIIGEEGNGKSTLMKWIYDSSLIDEYIEAEGEKILGIEKLGYLPQEMPEEDKKKTVYEYFTEDESFWNKTPKDLSEIAGKFGLTNEFFYSEQKMGSLSGGEKVKAELMKH